MSKTSTAPQRGGSGGVGGSTSATANAATRGGSTVRHGNIETYPVFTRSLKDVRCCDGDSVTLQCHVEALPAPSVVWERDGKVLTNGGDVQIHYLDDRATLHIRRVYPEDEGEYTCVAINNIGKAFTSACVIVDGECPIISNSKKYAKFPARKYNFSLFFL